MNETKGFDIREGKEGEINRFSKFIFHTYHAGLIESLRNGKVWPDIHHALHEAGLEIKEIK